MSAMNTYWYHMLLADGSTRRGLVRLAVERDFSARIWLERQHDAVVLTLQKLPDWLAGTQEVMSRPFRENVSLEDLAGFLRDLALMVGAGVPILEALRTIEAEGAMGEQPRLVGLSRSLLDDLNAGASVSEAFGRHTDVFPESVRNLVAIGEKSGKLDKMLLEGADHIERLMRINRDIRTALIYPAFVFATIFSVALFWIYYVVPNMAQLFKQLNAKLPPVTLMLVGFAEWMGRYVWFAVLLAVLLIVTFVLVKKHVPGMRNFLYSVGHKVPIVRTLLRSSGLAHATEHLALLIRAGVDVVTSLDILGRATTNAFYQSRIQIVRNRVARGERIASAMRQTGGFPALVTRMVAVGEESGTLDKQLQHLASEYRNRLNNLVASLGEIIKPAIIIVAGGIFLFLIVALLLPIYDLVRQTVATSLTGG